MEGTCTAPIRCEPTGKNNKHLVVLCGNIGCGKSTVLKNFWPHTLFCGNESGDVGDAAGGNAGHCGGRYLLVPEPIGAYADFLDHIYNPECKDGRILQFPFQTYVQSHYAKVCKDTFEMKDGGIMVVERGPLDGVEVFLKTNEGDMTAEEAATLRAMGRLMWAGMCRMVGRVTVLYIACTPEECHRRLSTGPDAPDVNKVVPLDYLKVVDGHYEELVNELDGHVSEKFRVVTLSSTGVEPGVVVERVIKYIEQ